MDDQRTDREGGVKLSWWRCPSRLSVVAGCALACAAVFDAYHLHAPEFIYVATFCALFAIAVAVYLIRNKNCDRNI